MDNPISAIVMALAFGLAMAAALFDAAGLFEEAGRCTTDTECAQHCPPPNDDPDCDGGPQLVSV